MTYILMVILFYSAHALLIPDKFSPVHPLNAALILILGVIFAGIRSKTDALHMNLALHATFYLALVG